MEKEHLEFAMKGICTIAKNRNDKEGSIKGIAERARTYREMKSAMSVGMVAAIVGTGIRFDDLLEHGAYFGIAATTLAQLFKDVSCKEIIESDAFKSHSKNAVDQALKAIKGEPDAPSKEQIGELEALLSKAFQMAFTDGFEASSYEQSIKAKNQKLPTDAEWEQLPGYVTKEKREIIRRELEEVCKRHQVGATFAFAGRNGGMNMMVLPEWSIAKRKFGDAERMGVCIETGPGTAVVDEKDSAYYFANMELLLSRASDNFNAVSNTVKEALGEVGELIWKETRKEHGN